MSATEMSTHAVDAVETREPPIPLVYNSAKNFRVAAVLETRGKRLQKMVAALTVLNDD